MHGSLKNTYMFVIFLQKNICDAIICQYVWSIHIDQGIGDQGQIQMVSCCWYAIQIHIKIQIQKHKGKGDQGQVQMVSCCCDANSGKEGAARLMCRQNPTATTVEQRYHWHAPGIEFFNSV